MIKIKRLFSIFCCFVFMSLFLFSSNALVFNSTIGYKPGQVSAVIEDGNPPYNVYLSTDNYSFDLIIDDLRNDSFTFTGLANGVSYWIRVVDSDGNMDTKKYTTPYVTIENYQLEAFEIEDTTAHLKWSWLDASQGGRVRVYDGDELIFSQRIDDTQSQISLTSLAPNTEYRAFVTFDSGYVSNIVTFITTDVQTSFLDKLDDLLKSLFVPKTNVDSNSDGIPDAYQKLVDAYNTLNNSGVLGVGKQAANIVADLSDVDIEDGDLPNFEVEILKGQKTEVFNWQPFMDEIVLFRRLLVASIWIMFFFFLIKSMIPIFKV